MKRLSLLLASVAFVTPAMAADVIYQEPPAPAPMIIEPIATTSTWTGLYIGGQAGVAFNGDDGDGISFDPDDDGVFEDADFDDGDSDSNAGLVGGAHVGYDHQVDNFVIGAVADINFIDAETRRDYSIEDDRGTSSFSVTDEIDYFGTVRGRLGYAFDSVLLYGTGGLAYAGVDRSYSGDDFIIEDGERFELDEDGEEADFGYSVGGGVDFLATQNISFGVEYLYNNLGENDFEARGRSDDGDEISFESDDDDLDFHTVWAKASYRFN